MEDDPPGRAHQVGTAGVLLNLLSRPGLSGETVRALILGFDFSAPGAKAGRKDRPVYERF
ncbi:hypothetical protein SCFA_950029 [anaerobic digester metagenome]|uniref:Uncharacterized protein n=1 Tax=anaerobic digester metagenome TaxID=1263854 RepID=A0A485M5X5_9ZZZZ